MNILLFGSATLFFVFTGILFIFLLVGEYNENNFLSILSVVVYVIIIYYWGDTTNFIFEFKWIYILYYFLIGLVYALLRTFVTAITIGKEKKIKEEENGSNGDIEKSHFSKNKKSHKNDINIRILKKFPNWWMNWVISSILWIFSDLIEFAVDMFKNQIEWIAEMGYKIGNK